MNDGIKEILRAQGFITALACTLSDRDVMDGKAGNLMREAGDVNTGLGDAAMAIERMERENRRQYEEIMRLRKRIDSLESVVAEDEKAKAEAIRETVGRPV